MLAIEPTVAMAATTTKMELKIGRSKFSLPIACHIIIQQRIFNKEFHSRENSLKVLSMLVFDWEE